MFKRSLIVLTLLLLPVFAHAWLVNAKTSPLSGMGTISPSGSVSVAGTTGTFKDFTVVPVSGSLIYRVTVDGANTAPLVEGGNVYRVPYLAGKNTRYIVAYFVPYTINITATNLSGGNGVVREDTYETLTNIPVGSNRTIVVIPNPGYSAECTATANTEILQRPGTCVDNGDGSFSVAYTDLQASQTVTGTFTLIPVVVANAGADLTFEAGETVTLDGSLSTSNQGEITYAWSGAGLTFGSPDSAETSVTAANAGNYTATLTITSNGIQDSDEVTLTVTAPVLVCRNCHDRRNPGLIDGFEASRHATAQSMTCDSCHDPENITNHYAIQQPLCSACHDGAIAPQPHGVAMSDCANCHDAHSTELAEGMGCDFCHAFPPVSDAHLAHFGLAESTGSYTDTKTLEERYPEATIETAPAVYAYGCAICHSVDRINHMNGTLDVFLYEAAATPGSLKARNAATAAYNQDGTCSGVYCHSTGQATPAFQTTPAWTSTDALTCDACHGNPPRYPTGGEGTATANSHINLALDGYATGHFSGIRGPWHTPQHGKPYATRVGEDSAPITCQTCHYETTDPAGAGPDGFYWLNTTGDYHVPGQYPYEGGDEDGYLCGNCHVPDNPAGAVAGAGGVLPLRHVNGKRDVKFDPREDLPQDIAWLPADPTKKPARPMWFTNASKTTGWPTSGANITWSSATSNPTRSWSLSNAVYDPATKSCSNTSCHVQFEKTAEKPTLRPNPVWGAPVGANGGWDSCCNCHTGYCY